MLQGLAVLLLCQSMGEALARLLKLGLNLPLPGPVLGMLALAALLYWAPLRRPVGAAADGLLAHLSLLFVPVGVGVMVHGALIAQHGARMLLALVLSTWIGLAVCAAVLRALLPPASTPPGQPTPSHPTAPPPAPVG
jgi:holin-like protein